MQRNGVKLGAKVACPVRAEIFARGGGRKRRGMGPRGAVDTGLAFDSFHNFSALFYNDNLTITITITITIKSSIITTITNTITIIITITILLNFECLSLVVAALSKINRIVIEVVVIDYN